MYLWTHRYEGSIPYFKQSATERGIPCLSARGEQYRERDKSFCLYGLQELSFGCEKSPNKMLQQMASSPMAVNLIPCGIDCVGVGRGGRNGIRVGLGQGRSQPPQIWGVVPRVCDRLCRPAGRDLLGPRPFRRGGP